MRGPGFFVGLHPDNGPTPPAGSSPRGRPIQCAHVHCLPDVAVTAAGLASADDAALAALFVPFLGGDLPSPGDRVLFLRARLGAVVREWARPAWCCVQSFLPFADALGDAGLATAPVAPAARFPCVLLLSPRQRDERRALFAQAVDHLEAGGVLVASVANAEGAKSAEADLAALVGATAHLSKHHCRVFWVRPDMATVDHDLLAAWRALDAPRQLDTGWWTRPGLFAWDRVDRASALLAANLPVDLAGHAADLGAGDGFLATQLVARCPGITALDLYEAEQRALDVARCNLDAALQSAARTLPVGIHWHDVTRGLPARYDVIVSNPPFHVGRAETPALGQAFIARAADALTADGRLLLVANRQLPYEAVLATRFAQVRQLALADGFKVIEARGVRP